MLVAEFHFEYIGPEVLDDGAHLTPYQPGFGYVAYESDDRKNVKIAHMH